jgi:serine/threonine protein kinase
MGASLTTGKKVKWGPFSLKIKKSLGEGGFGYVYLVKDKPTSKCYALKRVLCQDMQALQVRALMRRRRCGARFHARFR